MKTPELRHLTTSLISSWGSLLLTLNIFYTLLCCFHFDFCNGFLPPFSPLLSLVKYNKINFSSIYNKWDFCASYAPLSRCFVYYFIFQIWNSKKLMNATCVMGLNVCKSTNFFSKVSVVATKLKIFHKYLYRNIKLGI